MAMGKQRDISICLKRNFNHAPCSRVNLFYRFPIWGSMSPDRPIGNTLSQVIHSPTFDRAVIPFPQIIEAQRLGCKAG